MTLPVNDVGARLVLKDKAAFIAGSREAAASMKELGDEAAAAGKKAAAGSTGFTTMLGRVKRVSEGLVTAGRKITHFVTLPVLAIGAASVKSATDFKTAMTRIQTQAGGSAKDVRTLSKEVLNLSKTAQQGPVPLAQSLYHLKSVGMDNVSAMKALREASDLSAVSGANLEDTTNALAGAWRTGIRGAKNFHGTVSSLNAIVGAGNMKMSQLNSALGTGILPSAKTFGLTLKDVGSALALFTDEGVPAQQAATRLRMSFSLMGAPSQQAIKQLKSIGISQYELGNDMRKKNGMITAIGDLKNHLDESGLSATRQAALLSRAFGGGRSSSAILSMLNNYDVLVRKQHQVEKGMGRFNSAVAAQGRTPQAQFKRLIAQLEELGVVIGNKLLPYVLRLVTWISNAVTWFGKLSPNTKKLIGLIVAVVAVMGPLLIILGSVGKMMTFLAANPVVLIIAAIVGLAVGLVYAYKHFKTFHDIVNDVFHKIAAVAQWAWGYMVQIWNKFGYPMFKLIIAIVRLWWTINEPILRGIVKLWKWTWSMVHPVLNFFVSALKHVGRFFMWLLTEAGKLASGMTRVINHIRTHWDGFLSFMKKVPGKIGNFFKGVGTVMVAPFKMAFNLIARMWNDTVGKLSFRAPKWIPFIGGKGWSVPNMPTWGGGKALGGSVSQNTPYLVGERGPEIFAPNMSGFIVNNTRTEKLLSSPLVPSTKVNAGGSNLVTPGNRIPALESGNQNKSRPVIVKVYLKQKQIAEAVFDETARRVGYE